MRRAARLDGNHNDIVSALLSAGCVVQSLASVGLGVPDLLVGLNGQNFLLEVKDGERKPSERVLTTDEKNWHQRWRGQVCVVESIDEALIAVGIKVAA